MMKYILRLSKKQKTILQQTTGSLLNNLNSCVTLCSYSRRVSPAGAEIFPTHLCLIYLIEKKRVHRKVHCVCISSYLTRKVYFSPESSENGHHATISPPLQPEEKYQG